MSMPKACFGRSVEVILSKLSGPIRTHSPPTNRPPRWSPKQKKSQEEYVAAESNAQVAEDNLIKIETDGSDSENNYVVLTILGIVGLALVLVGGVLIGFTRWKSFKDAPKRRTPTKEQPAIGVVADTKTTNVEMIGRKTRLGIMLKSSGFSQV